MTKKKSKAVEPEIVDEALESHKRLAKGLGGAKMLMDELYRFDEEQLERFMRRRGIKRSVPKSLQTKTGTESKS